MNHDFNKLQLVRDLKRSRLLFIAAFLASFVFYYFMVNLSQAGLDFLPGRFFIAFVSLVGFFVTFRFTEDIKWTRIFVNLTTLSYFAVYLYLGHINDWTVFYRWSYAVAASILCNVVLRWNDFLFQSAVALFAAVVVCAYSPMTFLEQLHFHGANFTIFVVIGVTLRSNFFYQAELISASKALLESSKMASLGRLAGGIAHEINSPLAAIKMTVELIQKRLAKEPVTPAEALQVRADTQRAARAVDRIASIIRGLLTYVKDAPPDRSAFADLDKVFQSAKELSLPMLQGNEIKFSIRINGPNEVQIQEDQLIQVCLNLIHNSVDAMKDTAVREIKIEAEPLSERMLKISFIDSGPGVLPEAIANLMEPFFTTKEIGFTGLGLSVSKGIVEAYGGRLYYDAQAPQCTFVVEVPYRLQEINET